MQSGQLYLQPDTDTIASVPSSGPQAHWFPSSLSFRDPMLRAAYTSTCLDAAMSLRGVKPLHLAAACTCSEASRAEMPQGWH